MTSPNHCGLRCAGDVCFGLFFLIAAFISIMRRLALEISDDKIRFRSTSFSIKMEEIDKSALVAIVSVDKNAAYSIGSLDLHSKGNPPKRIITILINDKHGYSYINICLELSAISDRNVSKIIEVLDDICRCNRENVALSNRNHTEFSESNAEAIINNFRRNKRRNKWHDDYLEFSANRKKLFFIFTMCVLLFAIFCCPFLTQMQHGGWIFLAVVAVVGIIEMWPILRGLFKSVIVKINSKCLEARVRNHPFCGNWKTHQETISLRDIICAQNFQKSIWSSVTNIRITTKDYKSFTLDMFWMSSEDKQTLLKLINDLIGQKRKR
ncbi:hypothetical protein FACS1894122_13440 [Alphaproteobacteria bacterium]|nr:hypothetical protein FACS1894122_13440 [Alphaproteobacteria bacterium]